MEHIVGVVVFLVIAVPVGIFGYRLSQKQSERELERLIAAGRAAKQMTGPWTYVYETIEP